MSWRVAVFLALIFVCSQVFADQTPVYAWTSTIKGEKVEFKTEMKTSSISEDIKNILDMTDANSIIVYVRPGMTTSSLNDVLLNNNKVANLLRRNNPRAIERSYTNAVGMSIKDQFRKMYDNAKVYTVTSQASLDELKNEIIDAPKPFINQVYLIELPFEQDFVFDDVVSQIEKVFETRTLNNHVSVIAGSSSSFRNLQDTDVETSTEPVPNAEGDQYLTSEILLKALLLVPLGLFLIAALLQLYSIKTPTLFVEKSIDFGKIEK